LNRFIGILGIIIILGLTYLLSENKKRINWKLVGIGLGLQIVFALLVLKVPFGRTFFEFVSSIMTKLIKVLVSCLVV